MYLYVAVFVIILPLISFLIANETDALKFVVLRMSGWCLHVPNYGCTLFSLL